MIDVILLAARIALVALLFLFLVFAVSTGIGQVRGKPRKRDDHGLSFTIIEGPRTLVGTTIPIVSTVVIGRGPSSDIVVSDDFVSNAHARFTPVPSGAILEDLGSTNGTLHNNNPVRGPQELRAGDTVRIGTLAMVVNAR